MENNKYFKGFLGALIGALIGSLIGILFMLFNVLSLFSSVVSFILGEYLYSLFGAKKDMKMAITIIILTLILTTFSIILFYLIDSYIKFGNDMNLNMYDSLIYSFDIVTNYKKIFIVDLSLNTIFTIILSIILVRRIYIKNRKSNI